jgi:hypothetical protein
VCGVSQLLAAPSVCVRVCACVRAHMRARERERACVRARAEESASLGEHLSVKCIKHAHAQRVHGMHMPTWTSTTSRATLRLSRRFSSAVSPSLVSAGAALWRMWRWVCDCAEVKLKVGICSHACDFLSPGLSARSTGSHHQPRLARISSVRFACQKPGVRCEQSLAVQVKDRHA